MVLFLPLDCIGGRDFRGRNHEQRLEIRIEHRNLVCANEESNRNESPAAGPKLSAVDDDERAQFAGFLVGNRMSFDRGQKNCCEKHRQAGDRGEPTVPETERQDNERRATETEQNTESRPGLGVVADAKKLGNQENSGKGRADQQIAQTRVGSFVWRCCSGWGRAHLTSFLTFYLLRVRGGAQGFNESISRMRAKARRT